MLIQFFLLFFILFALSRVLMQLKQGNLTIAAFSFWTVIFFAALIGIVDPSLTGKAAQFLGIGRGADAVIYVSIAVLFYLVFRLSITIEDTKHEISKLVRELALREFKKRGGKR